MPVAGVARNPLHQVPGTRFRRHRLLLMTRNQNGVGRTTVALPGTIRRWWRTPIGFITAKGSSDFSWTRNDFDELPDNRDQYGNPIRLQVTGALRFLVSTRDVLTAGNQRSNPIARTVTPPRSFQPAPPLTWVGNKQHRPTIRNRMSSFGSRVPPENAESPDAQPVARSMPPTLVGPN